MVTVKQGLCPAEALGSFQPQLVGYECRWNSATGNAVPVVTDNMGNIMFSNNIPRLFPIRSDMPKDDWKLQE